MLINDLDDEDLCFQLIKSNIENVQTINSQTDVENKKNSNIHKITNKSNKKFKKNEFLQTEESNFSFNNLTNEIATISNKIDNINSNIENIVNSDSSSICILEQIIKNTNSKEEKNFIQIGISGIKIGRGIDCELPTKKYTKNFMKLSRIHAYIYIKKNNDKFESHIIDCNSTNGTFVNKKKIKNYILKKNDIITFSSDYDDFNNINDQDEFHYIYRVIKA